MINAKITGFWNCALVDIHLITHDHLITSGRLVGMQAALEAGKNVDAAVISGTHASRPEVS